MATHHHPLLNTTHNLTGSFVALRLLRMTVVFRRGSFDCVPLRSTEIEVQLPLAIVSFESAALSTTLRMTAIVYCDLPVFYFPV
jgi:hypothetical protein